MTDCKLIDFIEDRLSWELGSFEDVNVRGLAEGLAYGLKNNGYCFEPYLEFDSALCCPINKRREKYCSNTRCSSYKFCMMLRKENYV